MLENPRDAELYIERAELLLDHGDCDTALADLDTAWAIDPTANRLQRLRAEALLRSGLVVSALAASERWLQSHPDDVEALTIRGRALVALGASERAAQSLRKALDGLPAGSIDLEVEYARALAACEPSGIDRALASLDAAMSRFGTVPGLELEAVRLARSHGRNEAALNRIDRAIATSTSPARLLVERAGILWQLGKMDEAVDSCHCAMDAIDQMPPHVRARESMVELRAAAMDSINRLEQNLEPQSAMRSDPRPHVHFGEIQP